MARHPGRLGHQEVGGSVIALFLAIVCALAATKRGWSPAGGEIFFACIALSWAGDAVKDFIRWCRSAWNEGKR